jgi:hypothetical protein
VLDLHASDISESAIYIKDSDYKLLLINSVVAENVVKQGISFEVHPGVES